MSRIGDRLRDAVPTARGEQKALAYRAGVTPETLNRILSGVIKEPGFETIAKIARAAGLDMNRLIAETGEPHSPVRSMAAEMITQGDRRKLREFVDWVDGRFGIRGEEATAPSEGEENVLEFIPFRPRVQVIAEEFEFPVPPDAFAEQDFDYPQPWHYWQSDIDPEELPGLAAGPRGIPNLLNPRGTDVREVFDRVNQIVRVIGDSMEDRYFDGDLLRVDTRNREPLRGDPIAIYCEDLGGSLLGFYKREADRVLLVKRNKPKYEDVLLPETGWILLGPVVEIVSRRERRERV